MFISEELVSKYQNVYERKFGKVISAKQAELELSELAELIKKINNIRRESHED